VIRIEIEDVDAAGLARDVWRFVIGASFNGKLECTLDEWRHETRQSRRHKWRKETEGYARRPHNSPIHYGGMRKPAADVPMPDDVVERVKAEIMSRLTITGAVDP
jgi:hypothetical protein